MSASLKENPALRNSNRRRGVRLRCFRYAAIALMAAANRAFAAANHSAEQVYTLPPDKLAKAIALSRDRTLLHFGNTAWMLLALFALLHFGLGAAIARWSRGKTGKPWLQMLLAAPLWMVILAALELPAGLIGQHVERLYGISVQSWASWFTDQATSAVLTVLFGTLVLSVVYALMRRSPRRWWLWFWILTLPLEVCLVFLAPVVVDPLFDHFQPLEKVSPALVVELQKVVHRGGMDIPPDRMYVMDASAKLTGLNAYVTGFGASKRVVVWDNTVKEEPPDEILFTYGHEQGHYVLHHIAKGLVFFAALLFAIYWIGFRLTGALLRRYGGRWRIASAGDSASVALILFLVTLLSFLAEPAQNAFSRHIEHEADVYGQEVIHGLVADPQQTAVRSFMRYGVVWLDDPSPNPAVEFWTYSHPSIAERAAFAAEYDPWKDGEKPKFFSR